MLLQITTIFSLAIQNQQYRQDLLYNINRVLLLGLKSPRTSCSTLRETSQEDLVQNPPQVNYGLVLITRSRCAEVADVTEMLLQTGEEISL